MTKANTRATSAKKTPMKERATTDTGAGHEPSYQAAGIAALAVFILYVITIAPSTAM